MENKKTIIIMIILIIFIIVFIGAIICLNVGNQKQLNILTEESNNLLKQDLIKDEINADIKTSKNYAKVEKTIKEYLSNVKNIYVEMQNLNDNIDAEKIFTADNLKDHNLEEIDELVSEDRNKSKEYIDKCKKMIEEKSIMNAINEVKFTSKSEYYIDLYKSVMLSDSMKKQLNNIETEIENSKDKLYDKLTVVSNIKQYLEENSKYWSIKGDKIVFTNNNVIVQYYNLIKKWNS